MNKSQREEWQEKQDQIPMTSPKEETQKFDLRKAIEETINDIFFAKAMHGGLDPKLINGIVDNLFAEIEAHYVPVRYRDQTIELQVELVTAYRSLAEMESKLELAKMVIGKLRQWDRYHEELEAWDAKQKEKL